MQKRTILFLFVGFMWCLVLRAQAEDRIQTFVDPNGKVVFTNMIDAPVTEPVVAQPPREPKIAGLTAPVSLFDLLIDSIAKTHGVDPKLVTAMMKTESNFN